MELCLDKVMIKYNSKINEELYKLLEDYEKELNKKGKFLEKLPQMFMFVFDDFETLKDIINLDREKIKEVKL